MTLNVPGLNGNPSSDNNELAVYIHGVWTRQIATKEQIDRNGNKIKRWKR